MDISCFEEKMVIIVQALLEKGYDPHAQLIGYLCYNDPLYITRHRNARELIQTMDKEQIRRTCINVTSYLFLIHRLDKEQIRRYINTCT